jgi:hypothetical protein
MRMEKTTTPTRRVRYRRRKAKVVLSARTVKMTETTTMPTMSVSHHRKKAKAVLLLERREP